jgi:DNA-binding response OmpR family regulator
MNLFIADDDTDEHVFLADALKQRHFNDSMQAFINGQDLLNYLLKQESSIFPDIVLLDLNMPVKDGYTTLKELKSNDLLKHILLSSFQLRQGWRMNSNATN